jgi:undecaprenyl-diphosphatase
MTPSLWDGLVLGLVQGLTEFLPISSSGHLVLAEELLGWQSPGLYFEVGLHLATLLSVFIAYASRIRSLLHGLVAREPEAWRYAGLLVLGSVPAAVAGIGFRDFFARSFESGISLGVQFLVTAAMLWATRPMLARATAERVGWRAALWMGLGQAFAILPAISRSGATIVAGLWCGVSAVAAAEFSFLMSVIAIAGSGLLEARHIPAGTDLLSAGFLVAFVAALLSGIWAIRFLVALLRSQRFHLFAWYCAAVGAATILYYTLLRPA